MAQQSFESFLRMQRRGKLLSEITDALAQVIMGVQANGIPGSLTLKLVVVPFEKRAGEIVIIRDELKATVPQPPREREIYFIGEGGELMLDDPRQQKLPLRPVVVTTHDPVTGEVIENTEDAAAQ